MFFDSMSWFQYQGLVLGNGDWQYYAKNKLCYFWQQATTIFKFLIIGNQLP